VVLLINAKAIIEAQLHRSGGAPPYYVVRKGITQILPFVGNSTELKRIAKNLE